MQVVVSETGIQCSDRAGIHILRSQSETWGTTWVAELQNRMV